MNLVTLDFETFFCNKTYSVKKMGTEPYIRDARFRAHGCSIKLWGQTCWYPHAQLVGERPQDRKGLFGDIDWSNTAVLCHHAHFDGLILAHHYGVRPALWLDTLSMARAILGNHISLSLDDLRRHFWMPVKHTPYHLFDGKQWGELDASTRDLIAAGCCDEVESIEQIFMLLMAGAGTKRPFPIEELAVIDMTIRAFTEPVLKADMQLLGEIWWEEHNSRAERLAWLNIDKKAVGGVESFAELLREAGVEPEYKVGKPNPDGSIKLIYAFAKTDDFMRELLESEDDYIRTLAEARIGAKSTLLQSRAERIADMATRGNLCIYLKYAAANTLRWGGGDKTNFQNLRRSDPETKKVSKLRRAIGSAPDEWVAGPDESQIECIAEGQLVCTRDRGQVPIESVSVDDFVWDGVEWVCHEGLIYKGERHVITYQGLTATPEHIVYPEAYQGGITLAKAAEAGCDLRNAGAAVPLHQTSVRSTFLRRVQDLWSTWNRIQICQCAGNGQLCASLSTSFDIQRAGSRSQRQRWSLRSWKLAIVNTTCQCQQSLYYVLDTVWPQSACHAGFHPSASRMRLWAGSNQRIGRARVNRRADRRTLSNQLLSNDLAQAPKNVAKVYDLLNAGPRHRFMVSDVIVSNCRLLNFCAGQWDVVEKFRRKEDPYVGIASAFYQRPITKADEAERGTGKQAELSCGYGSSGPKFVRTAALGTYGPPVSLTAQQGRDFVGLYRETHPAICSKPDGLWAFADNVMLPALARGDQLVWGPCVIADRRIWMPNGLPLIFDTLEYAFGPQFLFGKGWQLKRRNGWQVMYGSKLVQNLMEALGRCIISQAMIRIRQRTGLRFALTSHDNIIYTIKRDERAEATEAIIKEEMIREPSWLPGIPLDVDSYLGERMEK